MKKINNGKFGFIASICVAALLAATPAKGVIFYATGDATYNTSAPSGPLANSGWELQGNWRSFLGTPIAPSYFITARHVGGSVGETFTFRGVSYTTTAVFDDPCSDLRIWRVSGVFPEYAQLYTNNDEFGKSFTVFGRGTQRGEPVTNIVSTSTASVQAPERSIAALVGGPVAKSLVKLPATVTEKTFVSTAGTQKAQTKTAATPAQVKIGPVVQPVQPPPSPTSSGGTTTNTVITTSSTNSVSTATVLPTVDTTASSTTVTSPTVSSTTVAPPSLTSTPAPETTVSSNTESSTTVTSPTESSTTVVPPTVTSTSAPPITPDSAAPSTTTADTTGSSNTPDTTATAGSTDTTASTSSPEPAIYQTTPGLKGWHWGVSDGVMRWGQNSVDAVFSIGGNVGDLLRAPFHPDTNPNQVTLSSGDSGGAVFMDDGTGWKLAGINYSVMLFSLTADGSPLCAATFDIGGLYGGSYCMPDLLADQPSYFFATRISSRVDWIRAVLSQQ